MTKASTLTYRERNSYMFTLSNIKKNQLEASGGKQLWFKNLKRQMFFNNTIIKIEKMYYFQKISYTVIYNL